MTLAVFLIFVALILSILAVIPPLRTYYLLNAAVLFIAIALIIESGAVRV